MKTLAGLKLRLLTLPTIRAGGDREDTYRTYCQKAQISREKVERTTKSVLVAAEVLREVNYSDALRLARLSSQTAAKLRATLEEDSEAVLTRSVEKSFIRMTENADAALKSRQDAWQREIETRIKDWAPLVEVLRKLVPTEGSRLSATIAALQGVKSKPAETEAEANQTRTNLDELGDIIRSLDLDTAFGKFLRSVASPGGAYFSDALDPKVKAAIDEHKLGQVFRVKLS